MLTLLAPLLLQGAGTLPAPLAWLVDQDDHPFVSRHLVVLEPGSEAPRTLVKNLLYCFDAADLQDVQWAGDGLVVNGPVARSRPAPNVAMPLHHIRWSAGSRERASFRDRTPERFAVSPDGDALVEQSLTSVRWRSFVNGAGGDLLGGDGLALGGSQIRRALWTADGEAVLVSVKGLRDGLADGIWRLVAERGEDGKQTGFGAPQRIDDAVGTPVQTLANGSMLCVRRVERERYTPHHALLQSPGTKKRARVVVDDLHWNRAVAVRPTLLGEAERPTLPLEIGYVRFDGALVMRALLEDAEPRELWKGPHPVDDFEWSPDGAWLAFTARDEARKPFVHVLHVSSGEVRELGAGLRPAWGPLATAASD